MQLQDSHKTASFQILTEPGGLRCRFFCDLSGAAIYTSPPIHTSSPEEALRQAWEPEGRRHFNQCHRCGRWVSDFMYNPDVLACVECAPWEGEPKFCPHCGAPADGSSAICRRCGKVLRYAGGCHDG